MNKYLLQPENGDLLRQVCIKYAMLMEVAEFTVTDLMELNGIGVQELMRFNPTGFYHDYIGNKDLLPAYAKLILNIGVLNRGILRDVAGSIAIAANTLGEEELKQKMMDLNTQYDPRPPVERPISPFESALQNIPTAHRLEEQWGLGEVSSQFRTAGDEMGTVLMPGATDGIIPIDPNFIREETKNRLEEFGEDLIEPIPSNDSAWVKDIQPSMSALPEDETFKIR